MVFSPNLLIQVCVMMYSLLVMCTLFFGCVERKLNIPLNTNKFFTHTVSLRALCPPPPCACGCLAYYYALSGRLPGWWSLSELDTEISSRLWCVGHQGGRVELVWSSASRLTLVNSSNETGLFLGGLFFISRVRGRRPRLAVSRVWEGRQLRKRAEEGS